MKKYFLTFGLLLTVGMATVVFNSCSKDKDDKNETKKEATDTGVVINGVKWATRNVAAPGTFATKAEDTGMFYQWNRKVAWAATGSTITGWDATIPEGDTWAKSNDPSPTGWRVPTLEEIKKLFDADKVTNEWTTVNGVNGKKFTDKGSGNFLFLPATGGREYRFGVLGLAGSYCNYWSSTVYSSNGNPYYLGAGSNSAGRWLDDDRRHGFCVRSVAE